MTTLTLEPARLDDYQIVSACRGCGSDSLERVIELGPTPLANTLPAADDDSAVATFPLSLTRCSRCTLVQLGEIVSPERLFSEYLYFSSFSDALVSHAAALVDDVAAAEHLGPESLVMEVASNDGYLLQHFVRRGIPVLGIEPARNIARVAEEKGIPTLARFFGAALGAELAKAGRHADVLIGNNVLAHVPDLNGFARGVRLVLKSSGVAQFEFPYVKDMLDAVEFDTIYHEHQCYFSATALERVFRRNDLQLVDARRVAIHGGSLRVSVAPSGSRQPTRRLEALLDEEQRWGVDQSATYEEFARAIQRLKTDLIEMLDQLKGQGARIAAYGAAAKGVTLASFCGIGAGYLDFVVDRSTYKQGRRFPVGGLPILPPQALVGNAPEYALLFTWNFAEEILRQQAAYRAQGGRFVVPVPTPHIC